MTSNALTVTVKIATPDMIAYAYGTREQIGSWLRSNAKQISERQRLAARYAYARAAYREGDGLFIEQVALLGETTVEKIMHVAKKVLRYETTEDTWFTNRDTSSILCNMMEM